MTFEDLEQAMRAEGAHVVSIDAITKAPKIAVNVRETQYRWRYGKHFSTLREAMLSQFPQFATPAATGGDELEGLLG